MNVLITGATGFVGSHLLKKLLEEDHYVYVAKRSFSDTSRIEKYLGKCYIYDIDQVNIEQIFKDNKIECIIHCATYYGRSDSEYFENVESNLLMPLELLNFGCQYGLKYFINTDSFFGNQIQTELDLEKDLYMSGYTLSKNQFRQWGHIYGKRYKVLFVNMRLEHVYGEADGNGKFLEFVARNCKANVPVLELSEGLQQRDFIHISDVVSAYQTVIKQLEQSKKSGYIEYQVGTGRMWSVKEFVQLIHKAVNSRTELRFGAIEMKKGEIMASKADNQKLLELGWIPQIVTEDEIKKVFVDENKEDA